MKKRIVCVLLTLIMLISLVPATAITASAATNAISESAIYVLKQLEGYKKTCDGSGYIGYGAKCPDCLGKAGVNAKIDDCERKMFEKEADKLLREELKVLDKAVNSFASNNGVALTQSQHDAMVMFSFQNGTAWTIGTGALQTAIKSGYTGSKFVDAICKWNYSYSDDARRMIEANMYLNGVYSSKTPSRYIGVEFNVNGGSMESDKRQYFDVASPYTISQAPKNGENTFLGWYTSETGGERVSVLNNTHATKYHATCPKLLQLYAVWQAKDAEPGDHGITIEYTLSKSQLASTSVYNVPGGSKVSTYINEYSKEVKISLKDTLNVVDDYVDAKGVVWAKIVDSVKVDGVIKNPLIGWVQVKGGAVVKNDDVTMDLDVTVTNTYVNVRANASITSNKIGSYNLGKQLRIINVKNGDGFLWGQIAAGANDNTPIGWVALMYTDYDSVVASANKGASSNNGTVVATATITYTGYVNVRSDAGINNQIVGSLSKGQTVDLYETKYVNGIQWGRSSAGWFCLTYASVTRLVEDNTIANDIGFTNYIFTGKIEAFAEGDLPSDHFVTAPGGTTAVKDPTVKDKDGNEEPVALKNADVTISNLVAAGGETWGKTSNGWIALSAVKLDVAKFYVIAENLTIRENPNTESTRVDLLIKGTEFDVTEIKLVGETIWGYARKVGEVEPYSYVGWANLSNENVSRNGAPDVSISGSNANTSTVVTMAKVVGTDKLRVRISGSTSAKEIGTLAYGATAAVLAEKNGWYKLDVDVDNNAKTDSWVFGEYLEIYEGTAGSNAGTTDNKGNVLTGTGIVANTYSGVNIRSGAGTAYGIVGKYLTGTSVEILEVTTSGASKWGRTEKGWVCMDYIAMTSNYIPAGSANSGSAGNNATTTSKIAIYAGKLSADAIVRKDTFTAEGKLPIGEVVRELPAGYPVTLHEIIVQTEEIVDASDSNEGATVEKRTTYWARVNDGYIFAPGDNIELDTLDEHAYTVMVDKTKMFEEDLSTEIEDAILDKNTNVVVTKLQIKNSSVWGYAECVDSDLEGWVNLSNMDKGFASSVAPETEQDNSANNNANTGNNGAAQAPQAPQAPSTVIGSTGNTTNGYANASGQKYTGKVINTNSVNVRATASTGANITTTLKNGASLVIYETVISEGMAWGRCDAGWVYLYYVDLTPTTGGAVDARVVYNDNTIIYSDMGMSQATGSTYAKMAVVDIYEIVGKMARTEMGWINTDNLL